MYKLFITYLGQEVATIMPLNDQTSMTFKLNVETVISIQYDGQKEKKSIFIARKNQNVMIVLGYNAPAIEVEETIKDKNANIEIYSEATIALKEILSL
jgi:hypothetical protein